MSRINLILASCITLAFLALYLGTQSQSIYGGDAGDIVTAAFSGGVAHPPGYPLYTALAYALSHIIPFGSVAWRVSLLSSIPLALSMGIIFLYIRMTVMSVTASFIAVSIVGTSYIYWLYASVPEVFGFHILLTSLQLLMLALWRQTSQYRFFYSFSLVFLLSLWHHQIILFVLPYYLYLLYDKRKEALSLIRSHKAIMLGILIFSALPVLYFIFSIPSLAAYTWEVDLSAQSILKIISRSAYGTFTSAAVIVERPFSRLTDVYAYFVIMVEDLTLLAVVLAAIGATYQYFQDRKAFIANMLGFFFTGPFFFFYGAYVISNSFTIATFERFVMPSYVFLAIWIACGVVASLNGMHKLIAYVRSQSQSSLTLQYTPVILAFCLLVPVNLLLTNYPKISILKNDNTAELLAQNILDTADKNAVLLLQKDNEIFNTSYISIANNYRPDVAVINTSHLLYAKRFENVQKRHPQIQFPARDAEEFDQKFIEMNVDRLPLYTNELFPLKSEKYHWVREGILYKLYSKEKWPKEEDILKRNDALWASYHDPYVGSLASYKNLMLASNLLLYRIYRSETGDYFFAYGDKEGAERHYEAALRYDDQDVKTHLRLSAAQMELKKCSAAESTLEKAYERFPDTVDVPLYFVKLYTDCSPDKDKVTEWGKIYQSLNEKSHRKLQEL